MNKPVVPVGDKNLAHLDKVLKGLSKAIQDSSTQFAFFRCRLRLIDEDVANIMFLASDEKGNWKPVDIDIDFNKDCIYYSKGCKPFNNEREILLQVDDFINALSTFPLTVGDVYWDLNDRISFRSGFIVSTVEDSVMVLNNNQLDAANIGACDAINVIPDKVIPLNWTADALNMYVDYVSRINSAKNS